MQLLIAVINDEGILDDLITGWMELGVAGGTVIESQGMLSYISDHVPIFAGFRSLASGGMPHNKTLMAAIQDQEVLEKAIRFLQKLSEEAGKEHQGVYFVLPMAEFGHLGGAE